MNNLQVWQGNPLAVTDPRGIGRLLVAKLDAMGLKHSTSRGDWLPQVREIYAIDDGGRDRFFVYEFDMLRLPRGVTKHVLADPKTLVELSAALRRRVFSDENIDLRDDGGSLLTSIGFSLVVDLQRREIRGDDLPANVPFDLRQVPDIRYPVPLGVTLNHNGEIAPVVYSLSKMGHIVFAAMTGAGKSGLLRSMLAALQLAEKPETLRLALVDPKIVEFAPWDGSPFLLAPVANTLETATRLAKQVNRLVDERMDLFARTRTFGLDGFNEMFPDRAMPRILFVVEEMRELALQGSRRSTFGVVLSSGAARWRAAGVHLLVSTTDPRTDTIDADILSNARCKIVGPLGRSLSISIIGTKAAEELPKDRPGRFMARVPERAGPIVIQAYRLDDRDFVKVADHICGRAGGMIHLEPERHDALTEAERHVFGLVMDSFEGEFAVREVFEGVKGQEAGSVRLTHRYVSDIGQLWESRGWLARKRGSNREKRMVTTRMLSELGLELPAWMLAENSRVAEGGTG